MTLIDSSSAERHRKGRKWTEVYKLIPGFTIYGGIAELLKMLVDREVPVGVVTSSPESYCTRVIEHHKFRIEKMVCYHDTTNHKPHPDPILKGIKLLGISANQVWAVGDDPKDITAAKGAGAHAIAVTWGAVDPDTLRDAGAEHIFDTVAGLHQFLEKLTGTK